MASAVGQSVGQGRARNAGRSVPGRASGRTTVAIVENPLVAQNSSLGRAVEEEAQGILGGLDLGRIEVRFRVCREQAEGLKFICKIESPAPADVQQEGVQWRWWSPLMETTQDFRSALLDAIEIRRQRLAAQAY